MDTSQASPVNSSRDFLGLRRLYNWVMSWADHRHGVKGLGFISGIEAIFFPIPVDPLLVAMGVAKPKKALWFAAVASICSVLGGVLGYLLGYWFWASFQDYFFQYVFSPEKMNLVLTQFKDNAFLAIFLASFTPIPYKVFTLSAGVAQLNWLPFLGGAIIGRGIRFFIIGGLIYKFGAPIRSFIDKHFRNVTIAVGVLVVLAFVFLKFLK